MNQTIQDREMQQTPVPIKFKCRETCIVTSEQEIITTKCYKYQFLLNLNCQRDTHA